MTCPTCHRPRGTGKRQCPSEKSASCIGALGGKAGKRTISKEQRAAMQAAKNAKRQTP